jgi:glutaredoxin
VSTSERSEHIVVFALHGCMPCQDLKDYIDQRDLQCTILHVDDDIPMDVFTKIFPKATAFPYVTVDGREVGNLMYYIESGL